MKSGRPLPRISWYALVSCLVIAVLEVCFFWLLDKIRGSSTIEMNENDYRPDEI